MVCKIVLFKTLSLLFRLIFSLAESRGAESEAETVIVYTILLRKADRKNLRLVKPRNILTHFTQQLDQI